MTFKCKPGDLAVVISSINPCNQGRIVRVIESHNRRGDLIFPTDSGHVWLAESAQPMTWYLSKKRIRRKRGPIPDSCLQPIRGVSPHADEVVTKDTTRGISTGIKADLGITDDFEGVTNA